MVAILLRVLAGVYALLALLFLLVAMPYIIFGPAIRSVPRAHLPGYFMFWAFHYFNIVGGGVIAYALWTLRPWGRYVAVLFNAVYVVLIVSQIIIRGFYDGDILCALLAVSIAGFLLSGDVKKMMQSKGAC